MFVNTKGLMRLIIMDDMSSDGCQNSAIQITCSVILGDFRIFDVRESMKSISAI